jgi:hypothetical protein
MALYDTMLSLKSPIGTHCLGFAFNLAGFILAAGQKVWVVKYILLSALCLFFDAHYNFFCIILYNLGFTYWYASLPGFTSITCWSSSRPGLGLAEASQSFFC